MLQIKNLAVVAAGYDYLRLHHDVLFLILPV